MPVIQNVMMSPHKLNGGTDINIWWNFQHDIEHIEMADIL